MSMSLRGISEFEPENPLTVVISPEASADDYLTAAVRSEFDRATVTLTGELDIATVGKFERSLTEAEQMSATVVLDLRGLEFIDCAGLHSFISARKRITASGGRLLFVQGPRAVQRLFSLTEVHTLFEYVGDAATA